MTGAEKTRIVRIMRLITTTSTDTMPITSYHLPHGAMGNEGLWITGSNRRVGRDGVKKGLHKKGPLSRQSPTDPDPPFSRDLPLLPRCPPPSFEHPLPLRRSLYETKASRQD